MSQIAEYIYALPQVISITASVNDVAINSTFVKIESDGAYNITGLQPPVTDDHLAAVVLMNKSAFTLTLKNNDAGSIVGHRFKSMTGIDISLPSGYVAQLRKIEDYFYILNAFPS